MQPNRIAKVIYDMILNQYGNASVVYITKNNIFIGDKTKIHNIYEKENNYALCTK